MVDSISQWALFKYRLEDMKIRFQLWRLRRANALDRILEEAAYDYTHPGGMGDTTYKVFRKGSQQAWEDVLYQSLDRHDVIWWIVQRHREETGTGEAPPSS